MDLFGFVHLGSGFMYIGCNFTCYPLKFIVCARGGRQQAFSEKTGLRHGGTLGDNLYLHIYLVKLDGNNYLIWSRSLNLAINAFSMTGYMTGVY